MTETEPWEFPPCISCHSSYDVDEDHIDDAWVCRRCMIQWSKNE